MTKTYLSDSTKLLFHISHASLCSNIKGRVITLLVLALLSANCLADINTDEGEIIFEDVAITGIDPIFFELVKYVLASFGEKGSNLSIDTKHSNVGIVGSKDKFLKKLVSPRQTTYLTESDDHVRFSFEPSKDMVGKKLRVFLEREDNLSKVALAGAFVPQLIPAIAMSSITWEPHGYTNTLMKWNHLMIGQDFTSSIATLMQERIFTDSSPLFEQCSYDFLQGLAAYSMTTYGESTQFSDPASKQNKIGRIKRQPYTRSNLEAFRGYMATTPTNSLVMCMSSIVADNLKTLHKEGKLHRLFGDWSQLETLNDETLDGISKLMVAYGFNLLSDLPGGTVSLIRKNLGMSMNLGIQEDFNEALKTSIQYTLHNGYMEFFSGRGWSDESAYGLASGIGLLEIAYRVARISTMGLNSNATEDLLSTNNQLHHQVISIGERAEAIASSAYQFVPIPEEIHEYAVPVAATILGPLAAYVMFDAIINYYAIGGANLAVQRIFTSATNGLVLGAFAYVILPFVQKQAAYYTQRAADKFMAWSQADKNGWVGYFAARNTHYKISFLIIK